LSYLTLAEYKLLSLLPAEFVDGVEDVEPGWVLAQLTQVSRLEIDGRLRKRYAVPFEAPVPEAVKAWVARIVDVRLMVRRGVDPQDVQFDLVREDATNAKAELKEAANGQDGLYELPLRADTADSGIVKGAPRSYSEASPYVWTSRQARRGRGEDAAGEGTYE
jgi:hypothetical protein